MPPFRKKRMVILTIVAGLLLLCLVGLTLLRWIDTQPICSGERRSSPDGMFVASAMDCMTGKFFSGETVRYFEFTVEGPGISRRITTTPLPGPYFGSRSSTRVIAWRDDSSSVRFVFPTSELRFDTRSADNRM